MILDNKRDITFKTSDTAHTLHDPQKCITKDHVSTDLDLFFVFENRGHHMQY